MYVTERVTRATRHSVKKTSKKGAIAQLGERLPCTQEVGSSILPGSTNFNVSCDSLKCQVASARWSVLYFAFDVKCLFFNNLV